MSPLLYSSSAAASSISLSQKILISSKLHHFILYNHNHCRLSLSSSSSHNPIFSLLKSHPSPSPSPSPSPPPFPNQNFNNTPNNKPLIFPQKMATCVDTSRAEPTKPCDPDRSKSDHHRYKYANYCRPNFSDLVSCVPNSQNHQKPSNLIRNVEDFEDDLWSKMVEEAKSDVDQEPILSNYYYNSILSHKCLEFALSNHLASKLCSTSLNSNTLFDLFKGVLVENRDIINEVKSDLRAVRERDPACISYVHCFLNFKGFLACQSHRIAHKLWSQGRKILALLVQNRVSEVFAVDIHPGAKIGKGILLDHATGLVIGETAVIGNNVSILHNVTLGGTGKMCGDRHPKIGDGVLIGAGTCVLGNVKIGDGAKIGAGSVVLKDVPPRTTAVGNPARLVGGVQNPTRLDKIPSFTMDHTSHINGWSDYVI